MEEKLTKREAELYDCLKKNRNRFMPSPELATILSVSSRTIKNDIFNINKKLNNVIESTQKGYKLLVTEEIEVYEDRVSSILRILLNESSPVDIDELADELFISKTTLINDVNKVDFSEYKLTLLMFHNRIFIDGSERNKQKLLLKLLRDELPTFENFANVGNYIIEIDTQQVYDDFIDILKKDNYNLIDTYTLNIALNLVMAFIRIKKGFHIEEEFEINEMEYSIAKQICAITGEKENIQFTNEDIRYISTLLEGQLRPKYWHQLVAAKRDNEFGINDEFKLKIQKILVDSFNYFMLDVNIDSFLSTFTIHVSQLIKRANADNLVFNDMVDNIKYNCPFIYDVAVYIAHQIAEAFNIDINDSEIAFIAIHIGFTIENESSTVNKIRTIIVCDNYFNVKQNLLEKLKSNFTGSIELVNVVSNLEENKHSNIDLILSTKVLYDDRCFMISPLFTIDEQYSLDKKVAEIKRNKHNKELKDELLTYIKEDLFFKNKYNFKDKYEVIDFLGDKAMEYGVMDKACVESIKIREQTSSTTFGDCFAIPHPLDISGIKSMIIILVNDKTIKWDDTKINAVFMFSIAKKDRHKFNKLYNNLTKILVNQSKLSQLISCKNYSDFIDTLTNFMLD